MHHLSSPGFIFKPSSAHLKLGARELLLTWGTDEQEHLEQSSPCTALGLEA